MGGFAGLATGLIAGAAAGKMANDRKERDDKWDKTMAPIYQKMAGITPTTNSDASVKTDASAKIVPEKPTEPVVAEQAKANGGIVTAAQPMPHHYDRMGWQRQSFKKNAQSTDDFGLPVVTVTRIK